MTEQEQTCLWVLEAFSVGSREIGQRLSIQQVSEMLAELVPASNTYSRSLGLHLGLFLLCYRQKDSVIASSPTEHQSSVSIAYQLLLFESRFQRFFDLLDFPM